MSVSVLIESYGAVLVIINKSLGSKFGCKCRRLVLLHSERADSNPSEERHLSKDDKMDEVKPEIMFFSPHSN